MNLPGPRRVLSRTIIAAIALLRSGRDQVSVGVESTPSMAVAARQAPGGPSVRYRYATNCPRKPNPLSALAKSQLPRGVSIGETSGYYLT